MAYFTRTHGERPHAKLQPPTMTGLAMHKGHPTGQNKGNANIYVDGRGVNSSSEESGFARSINTRHH